MASVRINEKVWRASVIPPVAAGARAEGDSLPHVPLSGIRFVADDGASVFLQIPYSQLPTEQELEAVSLDRLIEMFRSAK